MKRKTTAVLASLLSVLLLGVVAVGAVVIRERSLPVYVQGVLPPSQGYGNNTLALGNTTYVSGKAEFRLVPVDEPFGFWWAIGRTVDGLRLYRPAGQMGDDYVYATGFMMPQTVYRNSRLAPLALTDMRVHEIRSPGVNGWGSGSPRTSRDAQLIRELIDVLTTAHPVVLHPDYDGGDRNFSLGLLPEQTPGLAYRVDALIDKTGRVYLSTQTELGRDEWMPAGELFTRWARP